MKIDATGLSCPEPVVLLKQALSQKPESCEISVDNAAARENCTRFAKFSGYKTELEQSGNVWTLKLEK